MVTEHGAEIPRFELYLIKRCVVCGMDMAWVNEDGICRRCERAMG